MAKLKCVTGHIADATFNADRLVSSSVENAIFRYVHENTQKSIVTVWPQLWLYIIDMKRLKK